MSARTIKAAGTTMSYQAKVEWVATARAKTTETCYPRCTYTEIATLLPAPQFVGASAHIYPRNAMSGGASEFLRMVAHV
jgi:hypothetical protein